MEQQHRIGRLEWVEPRVGEAHWHAEVECYRDGRWQFHMDNTHPRFPVDLEPFWSDQEAEVREALAKAFPGLGN